MFPVYFHENYKKEQNNTDWYSKVSATKIQFFSIVTIISCAFLPEMNKSLHATLRKICTSKDVPLSLSPLLKSTMHHPTVLTFNVWSPKTFSKHWLILMGAIFCAWRNSIPYLCFICICMSDAILSDILSDTFCAICRTATTCSGILVGRFNLYHHTTNTCLWCHGPT